MLPLATDAVPSDVVLLHKDGNDLTVEQVRKRPVTKVMHQASDGNIADVVIGNDIVLEILGEPLVLFADIPQTRHLFLGEVSDAKAMCEASMSRPGEHVVQTAQLIHAFKARINRIVDILPNVSREADEFVVDAVLDTPMMCSVICRRLHRGEVRSLRQRSRYFGPFPRSEDRFVFLRWLQA